MSRCYKHSQDDCNTMCFDHHNNCEENIPGAPTPYRPLTRRDMYVFNEAFEGFVGCSYEPLLVSTQIVAGVNYSYIAIQRCTTNPPTIGLALVKINRDLQGNITLESIEPITS